MAEEVFVGAGAGATLVPEMDIQLNNVSFGAGAFQGTLNATDSGLIQLVPNLYVGCRVTIGSIETIITSNAAEAITVETSPNSTSSTANYDVTIHGFGAPVPGPFAGTDTPTLLADNWLGLVNTLTPPSIEAELKQLNLAVSGGRNFSHQFKGAETVSGGSLDISLNNGSWLYYALGNAAFTFAGSTDWQSTSDDDFLINAADNKIVRTISGNEYPLRLDGAGEPLDADDTDQGDPVYYLLNDGTIDYTFTELNGDYLPSFALEVSYDKSTVTASSVIDSNTHNVNRYCRIFTGCQVNSLTMNFEESQELTASVDLVTRRAFDAPNGYLPRRGATLGVSGLQNYSSTNADNYPFMFSDGSIKVFGQNVTRVKSGNLVITNNIAAQRFIGNTNRQIMSAHIPAQRTYELTLTMLITDTELWDELRSQDEYDTDTGLLELNFTKDTGEALEIKLDDYIITNVTVPFPEDKGPVEVEVSMQARTLNSCTYSNAKWAIMM